MFFNSVLFQCSKRCKTKLYSYIIFKLNNKRELQNIAINHSADIDYKDFIEIYKNCTKEPFNVSTIVTTQPIDKRFKKTFNDPL